MDLLDNVQDTDASIEHFTRLSREELKHFVLKMVYEQDYILPCSLEPADVDIINTLARSILSRLERANSDRLPEGPVPEPDTSDPIPPLSFTGLNYYIGEAITNSSNQVPYEIPYYLNAVDRRYIAEQASQRMERRNIRAGEEAEADAAEAARAEAAERAESVADAHDDGGKYSRRRCCPCCQGRRSRRQGRRSRRQGRQGRRSRRQARRRTKKYRR